jgi:regulator of sirC expression with transglutaminase-like and TPR domain
LSLTLDDSLHRSLRGLRGDARPLDIAELVARIDGRALDVAAVRQALAALLPPVPPADAAALGRHLALDCGFAVNAADFLAPENSHLDRVVASRRGLPITLALVYMHVGACCGLAVAGIGFPGHFLCAVGRGRERAILDPGNGSVLSRADCEARLRLATGGSVIRLDDGEHLAEAAPRAIALRMLSNLRAARIGRREWFAALALADAALAVDADLVAELADRARVLEQLGDAAAAGRDLERLAALLPPSESRSSVVARLARLSALPRPDVH